MMSSNTAVTSSTIPINGPSNSQSRTSQTSPSTTSNTPSSVTAAALTMDASTPKQRSRRVWNAEEDEKLRLLVSYWGDQCGKNGHWDKISSNFENRTNKDCRKRWFHSLDPKLKRGRWTEHEDKVLIEAYKKMGPVWHRIAQLIPGRTDDQCSKRYNDVLDPKISDRLRPWSPEEDAKLLELVQKHGTKWRTISNVIDGRTGLTCRNRWRKLISPSLKESAKAKSSISSLVESNGNVSSENQQSQEPRIRIFYPQQVSSSSQAAAEDSDVLMSNDSSPGSSSSVTTSTSNAISVGSKNAVNLDSNGRNFGPLQERPNQLQPTTINSSISGIIQQQKQMQVPNINIPQTIQPSSSGQYPQQSFNHNFAPINNKSTMAGALSTRYTYSLGEPSNVSPQDASTAAANAPEILYRDLEALIALAAKSGQKIVIHQHNHYHYHGSPPSPQSVRVPTLQTNDELPRNVSYNAPPQQPMKTDPIPQKRLSGSVAPPPQPLVETFLATHGTNASTASSVGLGTGTTPTPGSTTPGTFLDLAVMDNDNFIFDEADLDFDLDEFHGIPFNPS